MREEGTEEGRELTLDDATVCSSQHLLQLLHQFHVLLLQLPDQFLCRTLIDYSLVLDPLRPVSKRNQRATDPVYGQIKFGEHPCRSERMGLKLINRKAIM